MKRAELIGKRFGMLVVIKDTGISRPRKLQTEHIFLCKCDCGRFKEIPEYTLRVVKSCGCLKYRHPDSLAHARVDRIYQAMKDRCYNPNFFRYDRYGGRGIKICAEWLSDRQNFFDWAFTHGYEDGLTIDRIDNDKGYDPSNCRWVTRKVQANNTSVTRIVEYKGKTYTLSELSEICGIKRRTIKYRIDHGWTIDDAVNIPANPHNRVEKGVADDTT